jgi:hypothetical protein
MSHSEQLIIPYYTRARYSYIVIKVLPEIFAHAHLLTAREQARVWGAPCRFLF